MSNLRLDNIGNRVGSLAIPIDTVLQGTAKAWLNMNGTGTIATRDSFNTSSITDNGVGDYTQTFSVAMPNANYSFQKSVANAGSGVIPYTLTSGGGGPSVGSFRSSTRIPSDFLGNAAVTDVSYWLILIHGDPV